MNEFQCKMPKKVQERLDDTSSDAGTSAKRGRPRKPPRQSTSERKAAERNRKRSLLGDELYSQLRASEVKRSWQKKRRLGQECPLALYANEDLNLIEPIMLEYAELKKAKPCDFCGALLFKEEKSRKKWCCAEGELLFPKPLPLNADFYNSPTLLNSYRMSGITTTHLPSRLLGLLVSFKRPQEVLEPVWLKSKARHITGFLTSIGRKKGA